ncbi:ABC transporter permease [Sphaerobacter thermophilus]|jgi:peptide/nickel transport system permease protein|uniref:Binding-protein-dependent transport systems inner membrane component n=1 Tax=Sphaerobacter thermophilus (strain ATCC 49802 / DSM 20745 / KCCM 41009 / NCIMB 13125 / S 6022) TaxID=479434 RepID=D1C3Y0_SPHTD|nr:ABC transporter permease [Sphaerobacter thermophilus]ACZ38947.1 binding-protein-dependent transport systems inner membrane component [Sphaerobacter thermophilus DSM 20745]PZN65864.1 MAG: ABC transporter permease [Sphaerobacter thermophilus]
MLRYVLRRLVALIPVLLGISIVTFALIRLIPGDVVDMILGTEVAGGERADELRRLFGLDQPLYKQYLLWAGDVVRGDLGHSMRTGKPVLDEILGRLPTTIELAAFSVVFALLIAIPAGIIAALKTGTRTEAGVQTLGLLGLSVPNFWLGTLLILVTSRYLGWFPAATYVSFTDDPWRNIQIFILPGIALGAALAAITMRMTRSSLLEVLNREYINTARAKGVAERQVILRHAMKNAMIPVVTVVGIQIGRLLGGAIIIEQVFNLPGIGRLAIDAIQQRDYTMIQGVVLFTTFAFVVINLLVDLLYAFIDPRIRYS